MTLSVLDIFKVGVGPSSSHTMGPMNAAADFVAALGERGLLPRTARVGAQVYGSLALTGLGHCTDRAILLGLEFLVAGDIIRTVAISPTFASVGVLAIIVLIRTFLSATLTVEIEGRWPWQRGHEEGERAA